MDKSLLKFAENIENSKSLDEKLGLEKPRSKQEIDKEKYLRAKRKSEVTSEEMILITEYEEKYVYNVTIEDLKN